MWIKACAIGSVVAVSMVLASCSPPSENQGGAKKDLNQEKDRPSDSNTPTKTTGREKFAAASIMRNAENSMEAECYVQNADGTVDIRMGPPQANNMMADGGASAAWIYHSPLEPVSVPSGSSPNSDTLTPAPSPVPVSQLEQTSEGIFVWLKTMSASPERFAVAVYYRSDGGDPSGRRGVGEPPTQSKLASFSHQSLVGINRFAEWWKAGPIPYPSGTNSLSYKIGIWEK